MLDGIAWSGPFDDNINWNEGWGHEDIPEIAVEDSDWEVQDLLDTLVG